MLLNWTFIGFDSYELWIITIGALVCSACGLIGCFLLLKKMSLMGDAISHAVLPGITLGFMISGRLTSLWVIAGAAVAGLLAPILTDFLKRSKLVTEDAAIGAVFTTMFALGVVIISQMGNVDLDPHCVLYGEIAITPFDTWLVGNHDIGPRSFWILSVVFVLNVVFVWLFYKELKICTFDEALAEAMGLRPRVIHYMLMTMVSITTIASFESVGAIIVVAMLIAPGACAYLLTDRLSVMLVLSVVIGTVCSFGGYVMSSKIGQGDSSVSGCMAMTAGILFSLVFLFAPKHGLIAKKFPRREKS